MNSIFFKIISGIFFIVSLEAIYAIAWQTRARFSGDETSLLDPFAIIMLLFVSLFLWIFNHKIQKIFFYLVGLLSKGSDRAWLIAVLGLGLALRTVYVALFPFVPASDGATYLSLATNILNGLPYETAGHYAYWPPGYPFFMTLWLSFLPQNAAVFISNSLLFLVTGIFLYLPLKKFACEQSARMGIILLAIWPNLIASSGPGKENLLIALVSFVTWALINASNKFSYLFIGAILGFASLVQPGMLLLFVAVPIALLLSHRPMKFTVFSTILVVLGMVFVISPWSYRNFEILGKPVSITTNGGSNFYRANNPLADGRYQPRGEVDFSHLNEVEQSKSYYAAAINWIKSNPANFAWLVLKKQLIWLGDDGAAFYGSLKKGGGSSSTAIYFIAKAIGNAFWLGLWLILIVVNFRYYSEGGSLLEVFSKLSVLYLFGIHSFFESAPKYHMPVSTSVLILAVLFLSSYQTSRSNLHENFI